MSTQQLSARVRGPHNAARDHALGLAPRRRIARRYVHLGFGIVFAACALMAIRQAWMASRQATMASQVQAAAGASGPVQIDPNGPMPVQAARVVQKIRNKEYADAGKDSRVLIEHADPAARAVLQYNLGNALVRETIDAGPLNTTEASPNISAAKQAYRDALKHRPDDWDARHNLEIALLLAPEQLPESSDDTPMNPNPADKVKMPYGGFGSDLP